MLTILITIIAIIGWIGCVYYKGKAKEFESLFELSKKYDPVKDFTDTTLINHINSKKLNKDGSIAKKRGPKPKVQK